MTPELIESVARIARHCWRGVHWEKRADGPRMVREPLKMSHLQAHCSGGTAVGLAPIVPGESTTRCALVDFDSHKGETPWEGMIEKARAVAVALRQVGLVPIPFRSSGGKGIHILLLWAEPQDAFSVRELLTDALAATDFVPGTGGVAKGEVEIFPKQDSVPEDGFGNMFVLPLSGESLPLDPDTFALLGYDYAEDMQAWPLSAPVPVRSRPERPERLPTPGSQLPAALAALRKALATIPNEGANEQDYDTWRNIVFAIHHETGGSDEGLALAHEFSARSSKYDPEFLDNRVWPHIRSDRSGVLVTGGTIYALASQHENIADLFDVVPNDEAVPGAGIADGGRDSAEPGASPAAHPAPTFSFIADDVFVGRPAPEWIVKGVVPRSELVAVFGQSTAGKSFLALDIAASVQRGVPWRGMKVRQGEVAYIAAEGAGGFRNRLAAYRRHHEISGRMGLYVLPAAPNLLKVDQVKQLAAGMNAAGRISLVVVDTLAQVTPGADENSAEEMGLLVSACKALHRLTGATILLVHHAGKDPTKGMRGSSAFLAACDAVIEVVRDGNQRSAAVAKMKDGADGAAFPFALEVVPIGVDDDGDVIDSCVVKHLEAVKAGPKSSPMGRNEVALMGALDDLLGLADGGAVGIGEVLDQAVLGIPQDPTKRDRRREHLMRAIDGLVAGRVLELVDGKLRRAGR